MEEHVRTKTVQQMSQKPCIEIVEQPASKGLRFRYECERRSAGSIPGVNSTPDNKTYPTIKIVGYKGNVNIVVTCVTNDEPYKPHPHSLVGRNNCKQGYCSIEINNESMAASFRNLGIQCVKRIDFAKALEVREWLALDPFRTGFSHKENPNSIELHAVRLCFQAFLRNEKGDIIHSFDPIVSDPIYNKIPMSDLKICELSDEEASVLGGKKIILLCEKVTKDNIQVRFFEEEDGKCIWEGYGVFKAQDVHKQVAITFKTPKYKITEINNSVDVWIQLKRLSNGQCGDPLQFKFIPDNLGQIAEMVDQFINSDPMEKEPEPSPNTFQFQLPSGPPPHPSVFQNSLPNENYNSSQSTFPNTNNRLNNLIDLFEHLSTNTSPYIEIVEQPASKGLRFRHECERRSAGSIPGVNSTPDNRTYPTIQIVGYKGRVDVKVTCVTKDEPYRPHPHSLVGLKCKNGYCSIEINNESMVASFQNLGIQCVKRKYINKALEEREILKLDPFGTGFSHKENPTSIDLNAVRLCFQAFLGGTQKGEYSILKPIVSDPIYDKKAMSDLSICGLSDEAASVVGGKEIILLCEKVTKDIQVRFFEEEDGKCIWEDYGVFKAQDVHERVAITFKTPKYKITEIDNPVDVWIQLKRLSNGQCGDPLPFKFIPDNSDRVMSKWKRQKLRSESECLTQLTSNPIRHINQSYNLIDEMVDQLLISDPFEEPCTREGDNTSNLTEATFSSSDSSDFSTLLGDNLSASLHLTEKSVHEESNPEILVQDNINMSDSSDKLFEI